MTAITPAPTRSEELKAKGMAKIEQAKSIATIADDAGRDLTDEERATVKGLIDEAAEIVRQAKQATGDLDLKKAMTGFGEEFAAMGATDLGDLSTDPADYGTPGLQARARKSVGERFTEDEAWKTWMKTMAPNGQIPESAKGINSPAVSFPGLKAIVTGTSDTSAGALVTADDRGFVDGTGTFQRPLTVRDLVTNGTTGSDAVEFARITGWTSGAATVPEASGTADGDGSGDVAGTKPQSSIALERVSTTVKTVAHWIPATKRALSDASQIRTLIDNFLRYGLEDELEDQMLNGNEVGEDFKGILNTSGIQTQAWDTDLLVTTRKARTKVRTVGRATPTAYLLNPVDNERIDLTKDDNGGFYFGGPAGMGVQTLWGLPRVESESVPSGVGIVADWRQAILWDREQASIQVSDSHADFFIRNLVAILAELRAAFGVIRPKAFVSIDLTA